MGSNTNRPDEVGPEGPIEISQNTEFISKFQTPFDSSVCELSEQGTKVDLEITDDITGHVKVKVFDFSGLMCLANGK